MTANISQNSYRDASASRLPSVNGSAVVFAICQYAPSQVWTQLDAYRPPILPSTILILLSSLRCKIRAASAVSWFFNFPILYYYRIWWSSSAWRISNRISGERWRWVRRATLILASPCPRDKINRDSSSDISCCFISAVLICIASSRYWSYLLSVLYVPLMNRNNYVFAPCLVDHRSY